MNHPSRILVLVLFLGCSVLKAETEAAKGGDGFPSKEQKESYAGESFFAPRLTSSIYVLRAKKPPQDAFVQLLEQPDKRVLASLHFPSAHRVAALWNPTSTLVAINYQVENDLPKLKLFRVSATGLAEISLTKALSLKKIAPKISTLKDEDITWDEMTASKWKSPEELYCLVNGAVKESGKKHSGPLSLTFEVLISFSGKDATILSSTPVEKKSK